MTELLRFETGTGSVVVEVDRAEPGFHPASRDGVTKAKRAFEEAFQDVHRAAEAALSIFRDGALKPEHLEIEFGVRLNAEVGAVIAKTAIEGHLKVKMSWTNQPATAPVQSSPSVG